MGGCGVSLRSLLLSPAWHPQSSPRRQNLRIEPARFPRYIIAGATPRFLAAASDDFGFYRHLHRRREHGRHRHLHQPWLSSR